MSNREAITTEYTRKLHDEITDLKQKLIEMQGGCAPYILLKEATLNIAMRKLAESEARAELLELEREEWRDDKRAGFDRVFEAMNDDPNNPYDRKWSTICLHIESTRQDLLESQAKEARLREFSLDQWWYSELKSLLDFDGITDDAKRAIIGVIPNLIGQIHEACKHDWCSDGDPGPGETMTFQCRHCGEVDSASEVITE